MYRIEWMVSRLISWLQQRRAVDGQEHRWRLDVCRQMALGKAGSGSSPGLGRGRNSRGGTLRRHNIGPIGRGCAVMMNGCVDVEHKLQ